MQTLIKPEEKLKTATFDNSIHQVKEKLNYTKFSLDLKFYQKLFLILLTSCLFLIFPESPQDSEVLCRKYHSKETCIIW
tara:strand:- start:181 stop:417 length:237 start_codon:yes stop_codon:yes gene_type:complete